MIKPSLPNPKYILNIDNGSLLDQNCSAKIPLLADFRFNTRPSQVSAIILTTSIRLLEFIACATTAFVIYTLYVVPTDGPDDLAFYGATILLGATLQLILFQIFQLYTVVSLSSTLRNLHKLWLAWTMVFSVLVTIAFFFKTGHDFSRVWFALWYITGLATLLSVRIIYAYQIHGWAEDGRLSTRVAVVGGGDAGEQLIKSLEEKGDGLVRICGVFDDRNDERVGDYTEGYPRLGNTADLVDFARNTRLDMLIVSLPFVAEDRLLQILKKLWVLPVDIRIAAQGSKLRMAPRAYSYIGKVPFLDLYDKPIADWDYVLKQIFDKIIGTICFILAMPIMLAVSLAIKLDSKGPVLFKQKRYGFNNQLIEVYKFRSMYTDQSDSNASSLVTKADPRVTPVGRFIRKNSLDELPQLFNVLQGSLSLVGPRPHATQAKAAKQLYPDAVEGYYARHRVKPGITGWAQICGWRGETDTKDKIQKRIEHDLYYIENWSVFFDLYILLKTPFALLNTDNAY